MRKQRHVKKNSKQIIVLGLYLLVPAFLIWGYKYFTNQPSEELLSVAAVATSNAIPETVSYNFDVKPILSDKCYACHGPDQEARQADLRLVSVLLLVGKIPAKAPCYFTSIVKIPKPRCLLQTPTFS
jgi:hypothetical protein